VDAIAETIGGLAPNWNGKSQLENWPLNPLTLGAYSFWKKGQYTAFAGVEGEIEGTCHFCGEHTSIESQGYLNGAVESGERVASEVIVALSK
jgi:monoamine oxidase